MNDQAITYLKNIQSALDQLKVLPSFMERAAVSNERMEQLKQIYVTLEKIAASNDGLAELKNITNLLERIAASSERIEKMMLQSWEAYARLDSKRSSAKTV